ncbi:MAG: type V CRISPR-associated protein Cas4 [Bacteroidales bacterium]
MENLISISSLNDFIFCPYSIYLHNVYMNTDEDIVHAAPQKLGIAAHQAIDEKTYSSRKSDITALSVYSYEFGIMGKIDLYRQSIKMLIERKYKLETIYQGQIYQLYGQYFCMIEMGYEIERLAFYATSTNKTFSVNIPTAEDKVELLAFITKFKKYDPAEVINANPNSASIVFIATCAIKPKR